MPATPSKKTSAKAALVGTSASGSGSGSAAASSSSASGTPVLKHRKPLGEQDSDDDDEDLDFVDATFHTAVDEDDDDLMITDATAAAAGEEEQAQAQAQSGSQGQGMQLDPSLRPSFAPISQTALTDTTKGQLRRIPIPPHRMTPLKNDWHKIYTPLVEMAGLMVRMNVKRRMVEIKSSKHTSEHGILQKGADFVKAFALGFEADDAIALLRMDDLFVDTFEIKDVKTLHGDHLSRAIGRIAGKDGRTRFAIENASRTRVVVAETKIHILGSFQNIKIARDAVVALILGSPPGKVYANLKTIGARQRQRA